MPHAARPVEAPAQPVSCAALLAHKMGLSDLQATMAAGFAGGIGLSGGACGALGVAMLALPLWLLIKGVQDQPAAATKAA
jgi:hypothetical protein